MSQPVEPLEDERRRSAASSVEAIASLCRLHRIAFDRSLLAQQFPDLTAPGSCLLALRKLGFHAKATPCPADRLHRKQFPLLALIRGGEYQLLLQADTDHVLVAAQSSRPRLTSGRRAMPMRPPRSHASVFAGSFPNC
jgi:ABC-type bacteriocin/lantibiotic exporter with double-glycine peptidase domain